MKFKLILAATALITVSQSFTSFAAVKTESVSYKDGDTQLEGYLAYNPKLKGKLPGIIVVHEWMGLGTYAKKRAEMFAEMGYVAFAIDMYGKGVRPKDPTEAGKLATQYKSDRALMRTRALAGLEILKSRPNVDTNHLSAIGYCFGGTTALEMARSGANLQYVASFHGGLDSPHPEDAKNIKAKILALQGADDPFVKREERNAFEDEMRNAKVDFEFVTYANAVHSFTNFELGTDNSKGAAYNAEADHRSWEALKTFLAGK